MRNIEKRYINEDGILVTVYKAQRIPRPRFGSKHLGRSESAISRVSGRHR
jgi:hypothetical protein